MTVKAEVSEEEIEESKRIVAEFQQLQVGGKTFTADEIYDWTCHQKIVDGDY